ncbi:MAG TPA: protoporphyrinogen oxidase [Candidatus Polarisedimenticolia bacterium]|nr:protoporphyrinogen oxidase [Candidatus Polarisedimenticolia bacterium]
MTGQTALPSAATAPPFDVAIVGAGIAGLSAAESLVARARAREVPLRLTIYEAARRAGGVIRTERSDGFLLEAGPDCFITDRPWGLELCRRLGLDRELIGTNPACRRSFVVRGRRLLPVPEGFQMLAPARLRTFARSPVLSPAGKARAALDLGLPRGPKVAVESLASFVRRRFGTQALERLAQPLLAGIYGADPERLSLRATMPRFLDLEQEHRSVILGLRRSRGRGGAAAAGTSGARYSLFVTPRRGMGAIVERLEQGLPEGALRLGTRVLGIEPLPQAARRPRYRVRTAAGSDEFHAVLVALGAAEAAPLLAAIDGDVARLLAAVPYGSSTTVSLGYRQEEIPRSLDGFGFVVPRSEGRRLVACSFSSVKFAERAPAGHVLVRAFLADGTVPPGDADAAIACAREELGPLLRLEAAPRLARAFFAPGAMARYEVGHLERVAEIESRLERHVGLALAGNGLRGVGVPDCVRSGEQGAERLLSQAALLVA